MPTKITVQCLIDKAGGVVPLGKRLGVARTTVLDWRRTGTIPGSRLKQISREMGLAPCELLPIVHDPSAEAA